MLADVYRVPGLARACTVHSYITREGFRLRVNLQKSRVHGCAHAIRAILNAGTVLASIKFKSSCTVYYRVFVVAHSIKLLYIYKEVGLGNKLVKVGVYDIAIKAQAN